MAGLASQRISSRGALRFSSITTASVSVTTAMASVQPSQGVSVHQWIDPMVKTAVSPPNPSAISSQLTMSSAAIALIRGAEVSGR